MKLGCKYDRQRQSFCSDGHERPAVIEDFHVYFMLKKNRNAAATLEVCRKVVIHREGVQCSITTRKGKDALMGETYSFVCGGK